jgi:tetratricopeptide (TPR) repeat protein
MSTSIPMKDSLSILKRDLDILKGMLDAGKPKLRGRFLQFLRARILHSRLFSLLSASAETTKLNNALCEVLLDRDRVAEDIEQSGFSNLELEFLERLDEDIFKAGHEVYLRQPANLAAWREYRGTYNKKENSGDKDADNNELGWWWHIDDERGRKLSRLVYFDVYIVRTVIGLFVLYVVGRVVVTISWDTIRRIIEFLNTTLKSQNISILMVFNEATLALATIIVAQLALFLRIASWGSHKAAELFNLALARAIDLRLQIGEAAKLRKLGKQRDASLLHVPTRASWWRARLVSWFSVSPLFMNGILAFLIMLIFNVVLEPMLKTWGDNANNAVCLSISDANFASKILQGEQALMILTRAGRCSQNVGLVEEARNTYQSVLQRDPECIAALYFLASIYLDEHNPAVAMPLIDRGLNNILAQPDQDNPNLKPDACPMPNGDDERMNYQYVFRIIQVRGLLDQGSYQAALFAIADLWDKVKEYDEKQPELFYHLAAVDESGERGPFNTVELSYYYALALVASNKSAAQYEAQWAYVAALTKIDNVPTDSRFLLWKQDAACFAPLGAQKVESNFCIERKKVLLHQDG